MFIIYGQLVTYSGVTGPVKDVNQRADLELFPAEKSSNFCETMESINVGSVRNLQGPILGLLDVNLVYPYVVEELISNLQGPL